MRNDRPGAATKRLDVLKAADYRPDPTLKALGQPSPVRALYRVSAGHLVVGGILKDRPARFPYAVVVGAQPPGIGEQDDQLDDVEEDHRLPSPPQANEATSAA